MKEYQEETNNKDEDNEKLNPVKFESFNISLPEQEIHLPKQNTKRNLYLLIILVIIIIIIIICFLASSEKEVTCPKGYFIPNDANDKSKCMNCCKRLCENIRFDRNDLDFFENKLKEQGIDIHFECIDFENKIKSIPDFNTFDYRERQQIRKTIALLYDERNKNESE